jgi:hypothetical protein
MTVPFVDKLRQCASSMISIHVAAMFLSGLISRLTRLARTSASCAEAAIVANELQACKPVCDRRSRVSGDVIYFRYRATAKRAVCARFNHAEVVLEKHDMTVGFITNITHDSLAHWAIASSARLLLFSTARPHAYGDTERRQKAQNVHLITEALVQSLPRSMMNVA